MFRKLAVAMGSLGLIAGALAHSAPARAQHLKVGELNCHASASFGFIFGSSRALKCTFDPIAGRPEDYTGTINKWGVDIGYSGSATLIWTVLSPTATLKQRALADTYSGFAASLTAGVGVGANTLAGTSNNTILLEPLTIGANYGLNAAFGIVDMTLTFQPG